MRVRSHFIIELSEFSCLGKVTELRSEIQTHRATYYDQSAPNGIAPVAAASEQLDEDMEIEVETAAGTKMPAFVNADGTLKRSGKAHRYARMADLLEKLRIGAERRREAINAKRHHAEQNAAYAAENRVAIARCKEANVRMERVFHLYQEMRFFTTNVLNCLNEKMPLLSAADATAWSAWKTRADDLARRRAEHRVHRHRSYELQLSGSGWQSDEEESFLADAFCETMGAFF